MCSLIYLSRQVFGESHGFEYQSMFCDHRRSVGNSSFRLSLDAGLLCGLFCQDIRELIGHERGQRLLVFALIVVLYCFDNSVGCVVGE